MRTTLTELLGTGIPIVQAPMAGSVGVELAVAVAQAGALGSLPCALSGPDDVVDDVTRFRRQVSAPINVNFFAADVPAEDRARLLAWVERLRPFYDELGLEPPADPPAFSLSFDDDQCSAVEDVRPEVVSFHFGLPPAPLLDRVLATGAVVISSATTVAEAEWLVEHGCRAVIAQGSEAGGHRGMFLTGETASQPATMALVPQVATAVDVPVVAAGGIADGRGVAAALALGAAGVQLGTAFLRCPEASTDPLHRAALARAGDTATVITNVFTGRPARAIANRLVTGVGPLSKHVPDFPLAAAVSGPLRAAEQSGSDQFSPLWCGQGAALARELPAGELVALLVEEARERIEWLAGLNSAQ